MSYSIDLNELRANPFKRFFPEKMAPKMFWSLVSDKYSWINKINERNDLFLKGSRGCGKSTLLFYYKVDFLIFKYDNLAQFLNLNMNKDQRVIGIYFDCKSNFDQGNSEYKIYENDPKRIIDIKENWCQYDLLGNLTIQILNQLKKFLGEYFLNRELKEEHLNDLVLYFDKYFELELNELNLKNKKIEKIIDEINEKIYRILKNNFKLILDIKINGLKDISYPTYNINILDIKEFIVLIKKIIPEIQEFSFFLLFDDGDRLIENYQQYLNRLIKTRDHNDYCLKIVLEKGWNDWKFFHDPENHIKFPHDYDVIDLNELYTNNLSIFSDQIRDICDKRFMFLGINDFNFEEFFPFSDSQILNRKMEKENLFNFFLSERYNCSKTEYEIKDIIEKKEMKRTIDNLINKYLNVFLFRLYKAKHVQIPYSGYDNITYLSSGNIRDFLDYTGKMYEETKRETNSDIVKKILPNIQTKIISSESEERISHLEYEIQTQTKEEDKKLYENLRNLLLNLGFFFKRRFYLSNLMDVRLFSFVIKDYENLTLLLKNVFQLGIRENIFHEFYKSTKDGTRRVKGYTLHRLLLPYFSLDPTSLRGRIEFTCKKLEQYTKYRVNIEFIEKVNLKNQEKLDNFLKTD